MDLRKKILLALVLLTTATGEEITFQFEGPEYHPNVDLKLTFLKELVNSLNANNCNVNYELHMTKTRQIDSYISVKNLEMDLAEVVDLDENCDRVISNAKRYYQVTALLDKNDEVFITNRKATSYFKMMFGLGISDTVCLAIFLGLLSRSLYAYTMRSIVRRKEVPSLFHSKSLLCGVAKVYQHVFWR